MSSYFSDKMSEAGSTNSYVKQQDWERKVTSLDKQEKEVHQTQLKLIRDQTMAFVRDLTSLRHEVAAQKVTMDMLKSSLDREKQDRSAAIEALERTQSSQLDLAIPSLERSFREQIQALEQKLRQDIAREVNLRKTESESFFQQQLGAETSAREQSQRLAHEATKVMHEKLQEMDASMRSSVEQVKQSLEEKVAAAEAQHTRQLDVMSTGLEGLQSLLAELQEGPLSAVAPLAGMDLPGRVGGLEVTHKEHRELLERSHADLQALYDELTARLDKFHSSNKSRHEETADHFFEQLQQQQKQSQDHQQQLQLLQEESQDHHQHRQQLQQQSQDHKSRHDELSQLAKRQYQDHESRAERMEQSLQSSTKDIEQSLQKQIQKQDTEHKESLQKQMQQQDNDLQEHRQEVGKLLQQYKEMLGGTLEDHAKQLQEHKESLGSALEEHKEGLANVLQEHFLDHQKRHAELVQHVQLQQADHESRTEAIAERLQQHRSEHASRHDEVVQQVQELHSKHADHKEELNDHLANLGNAHSEVAASHIELSQTMEEFKQTTGKALDEHQAAFHAKLGTFEDTYKEMHLASQTRISELQEATMNEFNEYQQQQRSNGRKWEAHHVSIEERLDNVENTLNEYVDKQIRELEAAQNRLGDLQLGQAALSRDKDALRSSGSALAERLECLEQALGVSYAPWTAPQAQALGPMRSRAGSWRLVGRNGSPQQASNEMARPGPQTRPPFHRPGEPYFGAGGEEAGVDRDTLAETTSQEPSNANVVQSVADRLDDIERFTNQQSRLHERLDYLEGMVTEEHQRLWQAMDNHTHDLSSQVLRKKVGPVQAPGAASSNTAADSSPSELSRSVEMRRSRPSSPQAALGRSSPGVPTYMPPPRAGGALGSSTFTEPVGSATSLPMSPSGSRFTPVSSVGHQIASRQRSASPNPCPTPNSQGNWSPATSIAMMPSPVSVPPNGLAPDALHWSQKRDKGGIASAVTSVASSGIHVPLQSQTVTRTGSPCTVSPSQSTRSSLQPGNRPTLPFPWPAPAQLPGSSFGSLTLAEEEVERISCGRARYSGEKSTDAEVSK